MTLPYPPQHNHKAKHIFYNIAKQAMAWLPSSTHKRKPPFTNTTLLNNILFRNSEKTNSKNEESSIGILAFETAKFMSRLVSLYRSLSDEETKRLKTMVVKSKGVSYLNSQDEDYLLKLACTEKSEDLSRIAITVSRLSQRCSDSDLQNFNDLYRDLKLGFLDNGRLEYGSKGMEKVVQKMEKYIHATANLYTAIEGVNEMEISEKRLQIWKMKQEHAKLSHANSEMFEEKIAYQRKQVRHYKRKSLWSKSFDRCVELMAQIVFVVHARLGMAFTPTVISQPQSSSTKNNAKRTLLKQDFCLLSDRDKYVKRQQIHPEKDYCLLSDKDEHVRKHLSRAKHVSKSGPIPRTSGKITAARFFSSELSPVDIGFGKDRDNNDAERVIHLASPSTVGGAGLAYRYANVIIMAESFLHSVTSISNEVRSELYEMLPENVKLKMKAKLMKKVELMENIEGNEGQLELAQGWREAIEDIMDWLAPVAHDTMQWQNARNLERQRFDAKPACVLLLQTLHFADLEKTEASIVEVLVGLSCIYKFEKRHNGGGGTSSDGDHGCQDETNIQD